MSYNVFKCSSNNENSSLFPTFFHGPHFLFETVHIVSSRCEQSFNIVFKRPSSLVSDAGNALSVRNDSLERFDFLLRLTALFLLRADIFASVDGG